MGDIICVAFQRKPLKFHTKYLTHALKERILFSIKSYGSSQIYELVNVFETPQQQLAE